MKIFIVNTCDCWKTLSTMEKHIVTTSWKKAYAKVIELINLYNLTVANQELLDSCKEFPNNYQFINNSVPEIFIEVWED